MATAGEQRAGEPGGSSGHVLRLAVHDAPNSEHGSGNDRDEYASRSGESDQSDGDVLETIKVWDADSDGSDDDADSGRTYGRRSLLPFAARRASAAERIERPLLVLLLGSGKSDTLSTGHVALNIFSSGLHPGVLLAMPVYFARAGVPAGLVVLLFCSYLSAFGENLWVTLGRYVGGNTLEKITAMTCGMHTPWKRSLGKLAAGLLIAVQCTGAAVIAYHALTDLLLHVFFHFSHPGKWLHSRAFVTLFVGGLLTLPLLVTPLPKRALVQISSWTVVLVYPAVLVLMSLRTHSVQSAVGLQHFLHWLLGGGTAQPGSVIAAMEARKNFSRLRSKVEVWPWATTAMLPMLTMSALPAQILLHSRSLQRRNMYRSKVKAFLFAQLVAVFFMLVLTYLLSVEVGLDHAEEDSYNLRANLFSSFPMDDNTINAARLIYCWLLATHTCLCLATARSSWSRLLHLFRLMPRALSAEYAPATSAGRSTQRVMNYVRQHRKRLRDVSSGIILWSVTALSAFYSGIGGFRRTEKEGADLRFLRMIEVVGLLTCLIGLLLPSLDWLVLFHVRRPRAILQAMPGTGKMRQSMKAYLFGPLSSLIRRSDSGGSRAAEDEGEESRPLLASAQANYCTPDNDRSMPNVNNEESASTRDEATRILLARKEREMQKWSRR